MEGKENNVIHVIDAIQLGWLSVETFARLRRFSLTGKLPKNTKDDNRIGKPLARFGFSDRNFIDYQEVIIALERLQAKSTQLHLDPPASVQKDHHELLQDVKKRAEGSSKSEDLFEGYIIKNIWVEFEDWSREIWNKLQVTNPLAGRAFTYGASLADTYWHADGADLVDENIGELESLLNKYRLNEIIERFDSIADYLPVFTTDVLHHSLSRWQIEDWLRGKKSGEKGAVLENLKSQAKVWRDILFGLQRPESYLLEVDRHRTIRMSNIYTTALVILVGLIVWFSVLLMAGVGRMLLASVGGISAAAAIDSKQITNELLSYENWSSFLAILSSVVVILTGIITRLSGWVINFHFSVKNRLTLRAIKKRTYRDWRKGR
jgi:hypothetical protein